jgi:predicted DCC family thiol-disulfide oxidoreductase YuxK
MTNTVVFYDGVCGLCNRLVRFLIRRDRRRLLLFAPLQGATARQALSGRGYNLSDLDTVYVLDGWPAPAARVLTRAAAIANVLSQLGGVWSMIAEIIARLPPPLANRAYDFVARSRYRTFGRFETCPVPRSEWRDRFLE